MLSQRQPLLSTRVTAGESRRLKTGTCSRSDPATKGQPPGTLAPNTAWGDAASAWPGSRAVAGSQKSRQTRAPADPHAVERGPRLPERGNGSVDGHAEVTRQGRQLSGPVVTDGGFRSVLGTSTSAQACASPSCAPRPGPLGSGAPACLCPCPTAQAEAGATGLLVSSASSQGLGVRDRKGVTWGEARSSAQIGSC